MWQPVHLRWTGPNGPLALTCQFQLYRVAAGTFEMDTSDQNGPSQPYGRNCLCISSLRHLSLKQVLEQLIGGMQAIPKRTKEHT